MVSKSLNIIIVEDDAIISQLIEQDLLDAGHKVLGIAHNSIKALDYINNQKPDLVFLDIDLGSKGLNGIEIGKIINEKHNIPFIYLTAHSDLATLEKAKTTQPCGYIVKPYKAEDLNSTINIGLFNFIHRAQKRTITKDFVDSIALTPLSPREFNILVNITQGLTNNQISSNQFISLNTTKWHIQNIYSKMGVNSRTAMVKKVHDA